MLAVVTCGASPEDTESGVNALGVPLDILEAKLF